MSNDAEAVSFVRQRQVTTNPDSCEFRPTCPTGRQTGSELAQTGRSSVAFASLLPFPSHTYNSPVLLVTSIRPSGVKSSAVGKCESVTLGA